MAHPESDLAVARASVAEGIPLINSSKAMGDSYSGDIFQVLALDADAVLLGVRMFTPWQLQANKAFANSFIITVLMLN